MKVSVCLVDLVAISMVVFIKVALVTYPKVHYRTVVRKSTKTLNLPDKEPNDVYWQSDGFPNWKSLSNFQFDFILTDDPDSNVRLKLNSYAYMTNKVCLAMFVLT